MKILIVYYSRTGTTKRVAEILARHLSADLEEILTIDKRLGFFGYLKCGREASLKRPAKIEPLKSNPWLYDLVMVGTPVWAFNMASPIRAFLEQNREIIKKVVFFCTMGGSGAERAFTEMKKICGQKSRVVLALTTVEVAKNDIEEKIISWLKKLPIK